MLHPGYINARSNVMEQGITAAVAEDNPVRTGRRSRFDDFPGVSRGRRKGIKEIVRVENHCLAPGTEPGDYLGDLPEVFLQTHLALVPDHIFRAFSFHTDCLGVHFQDLQYRRFHTDPPSAVFGPDKRCQNRALQLQFQNLFEETVIFLTVLWSSDIDISNAHAVQHPYDRQTLFQLDAFTAFKGCKAQCGIIGFDNFIQKTAPHIFS